jgi:DNA-binding CsgD family transcriptional regulator
MRTNAAAESQSLSHRITQWAKSNDWYRTDFQTNQLRLEQRFGLAIEQVASELEYHHRHRMSRRIFDLYDLMLAKCVKIDAVCRSGCRSQEELLELELLRVRVVGIACELAEALGLLTRTQEPRNTRTQENSCTENSEMDRPAKPKRHKPRLSSRLSEQEQKIWAAVHVQSKSIAQAAYEFGCTTQNVYKHLKNAEGKMKAQQSRSVHAKHRLPEDNRGQVTAF